MTKPISTMYKPPSWVKLSASEKNPPIKDFFLEVVKNEEVVDRIDICDKSHYLVGRNSDVCDIIADHQSLSRVHAALLFHPGMKKFFLHDNNSVHGTFIGKTRLTREPKPLSANSKFSFGASTRNYIIRKGAGHESQGVPTNDLTPEMQKAVMMGRLSLPEDQTELDNLTDSNTRKNLKCSAHIPSQVSYNPIGLLSKARKKRVSFAEHNQVVNLADIDDKIGKFKNLVSSIVYATYAFRKNGQNTRFVRYAFADFSKYAFLEYAFLTKNFENTRIFSIFFLNFEANRSNTVFFN